MRQITTIVQNAEHGMIVVWSYLISQIGKMVIRCGAEDMSMEIVLRKYLVLTMSITIG